MTKFYLLVLMAVCVQFIQAQTAVVVFDKSEHDFGDLHEGEKREVVFTFKNASSIPFIISDVHVQCGCTAPVWPKQPILPGEIGLIKVVYNSDGKEGVQRKVITVKSNAAELYKLKILANVLTD